MFMVGFLIFIENFVKIGSCKTYKKIVGYVR